MCWFLLPFWEKKSLLAVSNFFAPFTFIKKIDCIFFRFLKQSQLFYFSLFPSHIQFGEWNCWLKFLPSFQKAKKLRERERLTPSTALIAKFWYLCFLGSTYMWGHGDARGGKIKGHLQMHFFGWIWLFPEESCLCYQNKLLLSFLIVKGVPWPPKSLHVINTVLMAIDWEVPAFHFRCQLPLAS